MFSWYFRCRLFKITKWSWKVYNERVCRLLREIFKILIGYCLYPWLEKNLDLFYWIRLGCTSCSLCSRIILQLKTCTPLPNAFTEKFVIVIRFFRILFRFVGLIRKNENWRCGFCCSICWYIKTSFWWSY